MLKFLHTADIHLDSPQLNLSRYENAPLEEFRSATRRALENIVQLAISEEVALVLIAGDLYDGDAADFNTPLHFRKQMERLGQHGIRVFIVQGNHDAASTMTKAFRSELPDNVKLFPTNRPETVRLDDLSVAIHGQGFAQRAVTEDLSAGFPEPIGGFLNIGLLHTSCGGYEHHDNYAPSSVKGLSSKGYDYWALGHIHKAETLATNPFVVYSGNPQGRSIKETGPRGCVIASYDGTRIKIKRYDVDVARWSRLTLDLAGRCDSPETVLQLIESRIETELSEIDGRLLAARIELVGACEAHFQFVRQSDYWDDRIREHILGRFEDVWLEKIKWLTEPARSVSPRSDTGDAADAEFGGMIQQLETKELAQNVFCELSSDFEKMLGVVPTDPRLEEDRERLDLELPETLEKLSAAARELVVARLLHGGDIE